MSLTGHKECTVAAENYQAILQGRDMNILPQVDEGHRTLVQKNKAVMTAIVRALL